MGYPFKYFKLSHKQQSSIIFPFVIVLEILKHVRTKINGLHLLLLTTYDLLDDPPLWPLPEILRTFSAPGGARPRKWLSILPLLRNGIVELKFKYDVVGFLSHSIPVLSDHVISYPSIFHYILQCPNIQNTFGLNIFIPHVSCFRHHV